MLKLTRVLALVLCCVLPAPALASDRTITPSGSIPSSTQTNQQTRDDRIALGIFARDILGSAVTSGNGVYANISVVPNGGMYVAAQPSVTGNGPGSVYQLLPEDPLPLPQNQTTQLSADLTPVTLIGIQKSSIGAIGPMTAPTSGSSVIYLIEAQVVVQDDAAQSVQFQNVTGGHNTVSMPINRSDVVTYQAISGTPSSSPTAPTATTGWVGIATVTIPSGTSAITSGMISPVAPLGGVVFSGTSPSLSGLTLAGASTGCLQVNGSGAVSSLPCTSGLGSISPSGPITSSTVSGVASIGCPTCVTSVGITGAGVSSTGGTTPHIALTHGDYADLANAQTISGAKTFSSPLSTTELELAAVPILSQDGANVFMHPMNSSGQFLWENNAGSSYAATLSQAGVFSAAGSLNAPIGSFSSYVIAPSYAFGSGQYALVNDGTNTIFRPNTSGGQYDWQNFAGTAEGATLTQAGVLTLATSLASPFATLTGGSNALNFSNATSNWISWPSLGLGDPSYTTRSVGTREMYYPGESSSSVDYARGIANNTLWDSIPGSTSQFQWYAGATNVATLSGLGALSLNGAITSASTITGAGAVASTQNSATSFSPPGGANTGTAAISWNCSNGGGEACFSTSYDGSTAASFYYYNGSAMTQAARIMSNGTIQESNGSAYGMGASIYGGGVQVYNGPLLLENGGPSLQFTGATTGSWILWPSTYSADPAFTTRSVGSRLVMYPALGSSSADYAIGVGSSSDEWFSIPIAGGVDNFKWFGGQTQLAELDGSGDFAATGAITGSNTPLLYQDGTQITLAPHIETFRMVSIGAGATVAKNFGAGYNAPPACTLGMYASGAGVHLNGQPTTGAVSVTATSATTVDITCTGN